MTWPFSRDRNPEPPALDDWTPERLHRCNLLDVHKGDIQRAVTAWEAEQQDRGQVGKDTPR